MRSDCTYRPPKPPCGLILSTDEDLPHGLPLRRRLFIVSSLFGVEADHADHAGPDDIAPAAAPAGPPPLWEAGHGPEPPKPAAVASSLAALLAVPIVDPTAAETEPWLHITL
jgi:hypothetical protein